VDGPAYHHSILLPLPPLDWKRVCVRSVRVVRFGQLVMFSRYKHHTQILGTHTFLAGAVLTSSLFLFAPEVGHSIPLLRLASPRRQV